MIALLALAAAAQAGMPPGVNEASTALARCAVAGTQARASGPAPAEAVADAALAGCAAEQQRLWDAFGTALGPLSDEEKSRFTGPLRIRLARLVNERRGLVRREENEATAAGDCLRVRAPAVAARPGSLEAAADILLDQCRAETNALRASVVRDRGEASADRIMPGVLGTLRTLALQHLQLARAAR
jgi:hypothetical protein